MWSASQRRMVFGAVGAVGLALVVAACADILTGGRRRDASLSFHVTPLASASATGTLAVVVTGTNSRVVDVQSVDLTVSELTFEGHDVDANDDDDSDVDSDSEHEGNERFRTGPTTISLPVEGGLITPFTGQLPVGTFDRLEMDVEFARLRGTVDGQPFDVTVEVNRELEIRFTPPLVVNSSSDPLNVSVNIDVKSWFVDANGAVIDPRELATNSTLRSQFRQRIGASIKAFEDEDRDADEDDSDSDQDSDNGRDDDDDNSGPGGGG